MSSSVALLTTLAPHLVNLGIGFASSWTSTSLKDALERRAEFTEYLTKKLPENQDVERYVYLAHLQACRGVVELVRGHPAKRNRSTVINILEAGLARADRSFESSIRALGHDKPGWRKELAENSWKHHRPELDAALIIGEDNPEGDVSAITQELNECAVLEIISRSSSDSFETTLEFQNLLREELERQDRQYLPLFHLFICEAIKKGDEALFRILALKESGAARAEIQRSGARLQAFVSDELKKSVRRLVEQFEFLSIDLTHIQETLDDFLALRGKENEPRLRLVHRRNTDLSRRRALPLMGREKELSYLIDFCDETRLNETRFQCAQVAGVGGTGKTRLALELAINRWEHGWRAGFIEPQELLSFRDKWRDWQPDQDTLLIIDYVIAKSKLVGHLIRTLYSCEEEWTGRSKVRLLLIERQPWKKQLKIVEKRKSEVPTHEFEFRGSSYASWYEDLGLDETAISMAYPLSCLELQPLDDLELVSLVRQYVLLRKPSVYISDDQILSSLRRIDQSGRALYAYFLGETIADDPDVVDWKRSDLLQNVLARDRKNRWREHFQSEAPQPGDDTPSIRLALLATLIESVNAEDAVGYLGLNMVSNSQLRETHALVDGPVTGGFVEQQNRIVGLEPDILGEWFLLSFLDRPDLRSRIVQAAWSLNPAGTAATLVRIYQDFWDRDTCTKLLCEIPNHSYTRSLHRKSLISCIALAIDLRENVDPSLFNTLRSYTLESDSDTLRIVGYCLMQGLGTSSDPSTAFSYFKLGAENFSEPTAMHNLAICYRDGTGIDVDTGLAIHWFRRAADEYSVPDSMLQVAFCLRDGVGEDSDSSLAFEYFRRAAEDHDFYPAMAPLGGLYHDGVGVEANPVRAFYWYRRSALEHDDPIGMLNMAISYHTGDGVGLDTRSAYEWYKCAAENHDQPIAMYNLALCFHGGVGVDRDPTQAFLWFHRAVEHHAYPPAMFYLALCYSDGYGVAQDYVLAFDWYKRAAEDHDNPNAMYNLGSCYANGEGVDVDFSLAVEWYRRASVEHKLASAMVNLALCFARGHGVEANTALAIRWLRTATRYGRGDACFLLSQCYLKGYGVTRSVGVASNWIRLASSLGYSQAIKLFAD